MYTQKYVNEITYRIIGCAIEVQKEIGPGLLESIYEKCLIHELKLHKFEIRNQVTIPLKYKGLEISYDLRLDILVNDLVIVELKATETIIPLFDAQILTYMKLLKKPKGVLINFNSRNLFREGQKTFVNEHFASLPKE
jgi:GxxExxY protein